MMSRLLFYSVFTCSLVRCASPGGITFLGAASGAAVGAGVGLLPDAGPRGKGRAQNVFAGSTIGALLGAGIGFFLEHNAANKSQITLEKTKDPLLNSTRPYPSEPGAPVLVPPRVDGYFVDDQIRGNIFVPGHFEYQIKEPARWRHYEANQDR